MTHEPDDYQGDCGNCDHPWSEHDAHGCNHVDRFTHDPVPLGERLVPCPCGQT